MRKLSLDLDDLLIQSFEPRSSAGGRERTVFAHDAESGHGDSCPGTCNQTCPETCYRPTGNPCAC